MIYTNKSPYSNDTWDTPEISMKALNCWNDGPPTELWLFCPLYTPYWFTPPTVEYHTPNCRISQNNQQFMITRELQAHSGTMMEAKS